VTTENIENQPSENIDPSLLAFFLEELKSQLSIFKDNFIVLEKNAKSKHALNELLRIAQSIEQGGRIVKLMAVAKIVKEFKHYFENILKGMAEPQPGQQLVLDLVNFLVHLSTTPVDEVAVFMRDHVQIIEDKVQQLEAINSKANQEGEKITSKNDIYHELQNLMIDPTMFDLFRIELENQCIILNNGLVEWEHNPNEKLLVSLMRAAHSIKGAAKVVGLSPVVKIAHAMEDCLVSAQKQQIKLEVNKIDYLLKGVDFLSYLSKAEIRNIKQWILDNLPQVEVIVNGILPFSTQKILEEKRDEYNPSMISASPSHANIAIKTLNKRVETMKAFQTAFVSDRVLRVSAQNLNRLMGLAGESLVESHWLYPFEQSLQKLKREQSNLAGELEVLRDNLKKENLSPVLQKSLANIQYKINTYRHNFTERLGELDSFIHQHATLSDRLYQEVINSRMRPFADGVEAFPRMVRDLSRHLGKQVRLKIEGKSTPVDRDILEKLESPLSHLLRNAVDHGIETPEERRALKKPLEGIIKLEARHKGGILLITVSDDGRGIDLPFLRQTLIEKKFISAEVASHLSESDLLEFLFIPGFSTSKQVTEISGRGVGLNIVQTFVQEVGGVVKTFLSPGKGISIHLQLPLTLSVIQALLVEISKEVYAFPLSRINQAFLINSDQVKTIENQQFFHYEGRNIGLISACQVLELNEYQVSSNLLSVVVVGEHQNAYGLVVDRLIGEKQLVVQELDSRLGKIPDISAGALMEDGSPALIIDVEDIVRSINQQLANGRLGKLSYTN
jgi:two-component system sensor histidine kinase and response regulator WspE